VLVLPDASAIRRFVRDHASTLWLDLPAPGHIALAALEAGTDPGDAVILLPMPASRDELAAQPSMAAQRP
jgi:hypothetical protein